MPEAEAPAPRPQNQQQQQQPAGRPVRPRLLRLRFSMPEWSIALPTELRGSFHALLPLMQDRGETLELSRWAFVKDTMSTLQLQDYAAAIGSRLVHLRRLQLVQALNW